MSPSSCFIPRETFCLSTSDVRTRVSTSWPTWSFSDGCLTFSQLMSEMWTSPSMPFLDLDEGAEVRQAGDQTLDPGADAVILPEGLRGGPRPA